jgi:hypothetical protein
MQDCRTFTDYVGRLDAVGVEVIPTVQLNGAKLSGLMYRLDNTLMKGSDLGKGYSPARLRLPQMGHPIERLNPYYGYLENNYRHYNFCYAYKALIKCV